MTEYWNGKELAKGIYNLKEFLKDQNIAVADFLNDLNIQTVTYYNYCRQKNLVKTTVEKINEYVLEHTDYPERYLLSEMPFVVRTFKKSANNKIRVVPIEEYKQSKLKYKEGELKRIPIESEYELSEELLQGKLVYQSNSPYSYQLIDEKFIVKYLGEKAIYFNPILDLTQEYYTLEKEILPLELGKTYITKNGKEVLIISINKNLAKAAVIGYDDLIEYATQTRELISAGCDELTILGEKQ